MTDIFLGIDIGTTAIKFGAIAQGETIFYHRVPLETYSESGGVRYQKASEILVIIQNELREIPRSLKQRITKISFSVAMHSCMPVVAGEFEQVFIWSDTQSKEAIAVFKQANEAERFYQKTGTPIHEMTPFAKILYFKKRKMYPENTKWLGLKELLMGFFTGVSTIDLSTASATGLLNLAKRQWDKEILGYLGISTDQLGQLVEPTTSYLIKRELADELHFLPGVQVFAGASDGCLAAYGGYLANGLSASLTIGTSAAVREITSTPVLDWQRQNFCYYLTENIYVIGAPSNNGGKVLEWASQVFADDPVQFYEKIPDYLAQSPIGAKGLRFFPYINGERAPLWKANQTAEFKGLTIHHRRAEMVRAVIEGVLFNVKRLHEMVNEPSNLAVSGGFFESAVLCQLTADILGADCWLAGENEPIYGLYWLITQVASKQSPIRLQKWSANQESHAEFQPVFQTYFD